MQSSDWLVVAIKRKLDAPELENKLDDERELGRVVVRLLAADRESRDVVGADRPNDDHFAGAVELVAIGRAAGQEPIAAGDVIICDAEAFDRSEMRTRSMLCRLFASLTVACRPSSSRSRGARCRR